MQQKNINIFSLILKQHCKIQKLKYKKERKIYKGYISWKKSMFWGCKISNADKT